MTNRPRLLLNRTTVWLGVEGGIVGKGAFAVGAVAAIMMTRRLSPSVLGSVHGTELTREILPAAHTVDQLARAQPLSKVFHSS